jgi:hypothetical protein
MIAPTFAYRFSRSGVACAEMLVDPGSRMVPAIAAAIDMLARLMESSSRSTALIVVSAVSNVNGTAKKEGA